MNTVALFPSWLISMGLTGVLLASAKAEPPRTSLKAPPKIGAREVKELVLTAPVHIGKPLPPGLPTVPLFTIKPNRFIPVSENSWEVHYQGEGGLAAGGGQPGGLSVDKIYPDRVCAYFGDGRHLRIKLHTQGCLLPGDVRKIRIRFVESKTKR
jgi:hypothetical protein